MLVAERRQYVLDVLRRRGVVRLEDLHRELGVSRMTVRRDLTALEDEGLAKRTHGGAVIMNGSVREPLFSARAHVAREQKRQIAHAAVGLIRDGDTIFLDIGSTTLEIARLLVELRRNVHVITTSLRVAIAVGEAPGIRVVVPGGLVRPDELSVVGPLAAEALEKVHVNAAILGVAGISLDAGLTDYNPEEIETKVAIIPRALRVIVVADAAKLGRAGLFSFSSIDKVHVLVTDSGASDEQVAPFRQRGIEVLRGQQR